jgi:uncharacterized RDD family membrane protein YckC
MAEYSKYQATLGKKWAGIKITGLNGEKLSRWKYGLRFAIFFPCVFVLRETYGLSAIPFLTIFWTKKRQCFHDLVSNALVINKT